MSYIRKHVAEKFSTAKERVICSETGFGGTTKKYPTMQHLICMVKDHHIFEFEAIEKDTLTMVDEVPYNLESLWPSEDRDNIEPLDQYPRPEKEVDSLIGSDWKPDLVTPLSIRNPITP